jgi:hypothetical protein
VCQSVDIGALNSNDEGTSKGSIIGQIRVFRGNAHANQPDIDYEEREHAIEDWSDSLFDGASRVGDFTGDDCDMLTCTL